MFRSFALSLAALAVAAPVVLAQETKNASAPALKVGMPAPALKVEKWVKGSPIASFEKGKVYMVEFWATWCGPCIASMPHLSALQREYKDKGFTLIGTNIWEDEEYNAETLPKVEKFVTSQGERMGYTVAFDGPAKAMDANYMRAAGRTGIPSAFLVDQTGTIAWVGHPGGVDYALSEVIAGTWDVKTGPEREKKVYEGLKAVSRKLKDDPAGAQAEFDKFAAAYPVIAKHQDDLKLGLLKANGQWHKVYAIFGAQVDEAIARKDANTLNSIAWEIVDPESEIGKRDVELAMRAALKADEFSGGKNAAILDTLARCYATKGDMAKAIEVQTKAVECAEGEMKTSLETVLAEYKAKGAK